MTPDFVAKARRMGNPGLLQTLNKLGGSRDISFVYILRLRSGIYYTGCSTDFEARFNDHANGSACRTTRLNPPDALLWLEIQPDFPSARKREAQIKKWSRAKKAALISGNLNRLRSLSKNRNAKSGTPEGTIPVPGSGVLTQSKKTPGTEKVSGQPVKND